MPDKPTQSDTVLPWRHRDVCRWCGKMLTPSTCAGTTEHKRPICWQCVDEMDFPPVMEDWGVNDNT